VLDLAHRESKPRPRGGRPKPWMGKVGKGGGTGGGGWTSGLLNRKEPAFKMCVVPHRGGSGEITNKEGRTGHQEGGSSPILESGGDKRFAERKGKSGVHL